MVKPAPDLSSRHGMEAVIIQHLLKYCPPSSRTWRTSSHAKATPAVRRSTCCKRTHIGISACHGQRKRCRLRVDADELRRDGCHRKPPQHWAPLTSTLVPRSLSEVRWRRQGSWSTSRGPRSAHCRDALCADLFKVLPDLHRRDQMTAERRPARARSIRATVPRAAWLEQVPLRRTGRLSPA